MSQPHAQLPARASASAEPCPELVEAPAFLCIRCRYNLHGLAEDGLCPECGLPIRASREGTPLHHYPPQWLDRVAQGVTLLAAGLWASAALRLVLLLNIIPYTSKVPAGEFPTARAAGIVIDLLLFVGYWMTAAPPPQAHEGVFSSRRLMRLAAVVMVALDLLIYTAVLKTRVQRAGYYFAYFGVEIVWIGLLTLHLRQLAALLGRPGLALQLSIAFVGLAAALAAGREALWLADLVRMTLWRHMPLPRMTLADAAWWPFILYFGVALMQFRFAFLKAARGRE